MAEHPRQWTCRKAQYLPCWFIDDAAGNHVGEIDDEETARLIVDLANAAHVQRTTGWAVRNYGAGKWGVCDDEGIGFPSLDEWEEYGESPTPHEAILAAAAWLEKQKGGTQ